MGSRLIRICVLCLVGCVYAFSAPSSAQAQDVERTLESENPSEVRGAPEEQVVAADTFSVKLATIVLQMDQTAEKILEARDRIGRVDGIELISGLLAEHANEVDSLFQTYSNLPAFDLSVRDLNNIERVWSRLYLQGVKWDKMLVDRLEQLEEVEVWLDDERSAWRRIAEEASELDYSLFATRVSRLFSQMDDIDALVKSRLTVIVGLSDILDNQLLLAEQIGEGLALRLNRAQSRLFERDSPWIFSALFGEGSYDLSSDLLRATDRDSQAMRAYFLTYPDRFVKYGISLLLLLIVGFLIQRRSYRWDPDHPALHGLIHVVKRPISVSVLLSVILASLLFQNAPLVMTDIVQVVALIPLIRILPEMMPKSSRRPFYVFMGLLLLHFTSDFFRVGSPVERMVVLTSTTGAALMIGYFLYGRDSLVRTEMNNWWRIVTALLHIGLIALIVSIVANLVGYSSLSKMLSDNILTSVYSGFGVFAAVQILEGSWSLLLSSIFARKLHSVRLHNAVFYRRGVFLIRLFLILWWFDRLLNRFGVSYVLTDWIAFVNSTEFDFGALTIDLGNIVTFFVTMWIAVLISRMVRFFLQNDVYPRLSLGRGMSSAMSTLTNYSILAVGFVMAFSAAGMDFENIALLAGAFGIGIGFGLQSIVNNFLSGLILIFERPIQVGDTIEFQGANGPQLGKVKRIGIRASIVRSLDGAEIIIPNANLVSNDVTNWTKSDQLRRVEVKVGVAYGSDPDEVLALLLRVAENHPEILKRPEPVALFMEFGDSSLNFSLRGWTPDFDNYLVLRSQLTVEVFRALKKAEITIPFPQQDVHIKTDERKQD